MPRTNHPSESSSSRVSLRKLHHGVVHDRQSEVGEPDSAVGCHQHVVLQILLSSFILNVFISEETYAFEVTMHLVEQRSLAGKQKII